MCGLFPFTVSTFHSFSYIVKKKILLRSRSLFSIDVLSTWAFVADYDGTHIVKIELINILNSSDE